MKPVLYFFASLSAVGLTLSIVSHGAALLGTSGLSVITLGYFTSEYLSSGFLPY